MGPPGVYAVIMAGGRGTRFWPASVRERPKQFMDLLGGGTMLQLTAGRFRNLCGNGGIMVVTGAEHGRTVMDQLPLIKEEDVLLEPVGRNTAACIGWAAEVLSRRGLEDSIMAVAASDHRIEPVSGFESTMRKAFELARQDYLCTIGVNPDHPATGYGYLRRGDTAGPGWKVREFREKPDRQTAEEYVESGDYLWNSGMFVWKVSVFREELKRHMPGLFTALGELPDTVRPSLEQYGALEADSIDYGVMERTDRAALVAAEFQWSDIGDWTGARKAGVGRGETMLQDSRDVLVFDETGRLTVVAGLSGVNVVSTEKAVLVMADSHSQQVRDIVKVLEEERPELT